MRQSTLRRSSTRINWRQSFSQWRSRRDYRKLVNFGSKLAEDSRASRLGNDLFLYTRHLSRSKKYTGRWYLYTGFPASHYTNCHNYRCIH